MDDDPGVVNEIHSRQKFDNYARVVRVYFARRNSEIRKRSRENHKYAVLIVGACDGHKLTLKKHDYDLNTKKKKSYFRTNAFIAELCDGSRNSVKHT